MRILRSNRCLCFLYWILVSSRSVCGYNLDTKFRIVFKNETSQDDYFGFAVGLLSSTDGYKALITAPRANSTVSPRVTSLHNPGALFSCDISVNVSTSTCDEVSVDTEGNTRSSSVYGNKRDDMWLGVSLDVQQGPKDNNVVVCGHLWKNHVATSDFKQYYVSGACYVMDSNLNPSTVEKLLPFLESRPSKYSADYYYQGGQAGCSAAFSEDGKFLLLGSPGFYHWTGTVISYKLGRTQDLHNPIITNPNMPGADAKYIGYSITSGKFFGGNTVYTVVGAPRDSGYRGKVYVISSLSYTSQEFKIEGTREGAQFGEYFGAAVSGIDVNGDGLTDLLVGAPFHSEDNGGDEGKVYVYMGSRKGSLTNGPSIFGQKKVNARFGTCIGNTGDLNQDGFNDVAIGAPYEDENGAVYIYHGAKGGLKTNYVQRISAADIKDTVVSGFGISISRGLDIDSNSYPDLLIGSYASSSAVLLRTYPVIQLSSKMEFYPSEINMNVTDCLCGGKNLTCFNVTYCLRYFGKHVPPSLVFKTELKIDTHRRRNAATRRGFLLCDGENRSSVSQQAHLNKGRNLKCFQRTAYIHANVRDQITPVHFVLSYDLDRDNMAICQNDSFSKNCPVIDPSSPTSTTRPIHFLRDCGEDGTCLADLVVEAYVVGNPEGRCLIIGQNTTLTIDVTLSNRGDPAYGTELYILLPPEIALVKHDLCEVDSTKEGQYDNITLRCDLGAVKTEKAERIEVKIDVKDIPVSTSLLYIYFGANSASNETDASNNELWLPIYFEAAANINITGNPEDEQIPLTDEKNIASIIHKYYVRYNGPSPVKEIDIYLHVPTAVKEKKFLDVIGLETDGGEIATKCNISFPKYDWNKPKYNVSNWNDQTDEDTGISSSGGAHHIRKRSTSESTTVSAEKRGDDHVVDCHQTSCEVIHCVAGPFLSGQKSIKISLSAQIHITNLSSVMGAWNSIKFISEGEISMHGVRMLTENCRNRTTVETVIVRPGPSPPEKVQKWIIFVSIGGGILLLLIILFALIKVGFFKRQQRDQMKRMMHEAHVNELHPQSAPDGATGETADDKELCATNDDHA